MPRQVSIPARPVQHKYLRVSPAGATPLSAMQGLAKNSKDINYHSLLKGQEAERRRLAQDLHDGVGGLLFSVKHSLQKLKAAMHLSRENKLVFENSLFMLDSSISELRRVAHNMMPLALEKFGLDAALQDYCHAINLSTGLDVQYQSFNLKKRLENGIEIQVYRIIQELVNNTVKHAKASQVLVQIIRAGKRLSITVEDNGKGFDYQDAHGHKGAGLLNIATRVEHLKGEIHFQSEPRKGSSVFIELNLSKL